MAKPVVEMDGDEMTRIIWQFIKDKVVPSGVGGSSPRLPPASSPTHLMPLSPGGVGCRSPVSLLPPILPLCPDHLWFSGRLAAACAHSLSLLLAPKPACPNLYPRWCVDRGAGLGKARILSISPPLSQHAASRWGRSTGLVGVQLCLSHLFF